MNELSDQSAPKKVVFCVPTIAGPYPEFIASLEASLPLIVAAGWEEGLVQEVGNPYISAARACMTRKALDAGATVIIYLDHDLSWEPSDLLKLLETEGDIVGGTYRFKHEPEKYMGTLCTVDDLPFVRESDGALRSQLIPAGFMKVTKNALIRLARAYPELLYGDPFNYHIDLFNHGAKDGVWWGEDYALSKRWGDLGGEIWTPPDLNIHHHSKDEIYKGNLHQFLLRQEGGSNFEKENTNEYSRQSKPA